MRNTLITILRDKNTGSALFRKTAEKFAYLLAQEAAANIKTKKIRVQTPFTTTSGERLEQEIVLIPILRSGLGFLPAFISYFENVKIGFIGLKRNEKTAVAYEYYRNLPTIKNDDLVIILDPMLATGGSATDALKILAKEGIKQKNILFVSLIAAPEGLNKVKKEFPDVKIIVGIVDKGLNKQKYILPGIGDFGDRYFGTL
jgi:uracil phosphoribosyltransferase